MTRPTEPRTIRVFVSSTFRDMQAEREELVKQVFPELKRRCRERGVEFTDVDLRWGVTEERSQRGEVLPICLAEIEKCRPYFICHLGNRYGWVPNEINPALIHEQPWLEEHQEKSVTELEIIHGVLQNPIMKKHTFFYFRDPTVSEQIEQQLKQESDYQTEPPGSEAKLKSLKDEIHQSGYPLEANYTDAKSFGKSVLAELWAAIDSEYPEGTKPTRLEREQMDHEAFAEVRRKTYIGREAYYTQLNDHVASDREPLVLLGESGSGKSALIANWIARYRKAHPDNFIITRFIGGTPDSADYVTLLRGIMEEIKVRYESDSENDEKYHLATPQLIDYDGQDEIPSDPEKIKEAFPIWLAKASSMESKEDRRFILILDALNQLNDRDNASGLGWLPEYINPNVRLILSTLPGKSLEALQKREWPILTIAPLEFQERERFIREYLERFAKELRPTQVARIVQAELTTNPFFLRTLLEELRVFGIHEALDERIDYYLEAQTVEVLFTKVLERYERDYDRERPGLVGEAMSLIWAARNGLSEDELLELLGTNDQLLPKADWSPLYLAAEESLVNRSGLLSFFHDFMRQAVEVRYLNRKEEKQKVHFRIADYFDRRVTDERKVNELPWQLCQSESWEKLKNCITNLEMFLNLATNEKQIELTSYWLAMGERFDLAKEYTASLQKYEETAPNKEILSKIFHRVAFFLQVNAKFEAAQKIYQRTLSIKEDVFGLDHMETADCLNGLGEMLWQKTDFEGAELFLRRALEIRRKTLGSDHRETIHALNNLAVLFWSKGDYDAAEPLYRKVLDIRKKVLGTEHVETATSFNCLAVLLWSKGDYDGAELYYRKALAIREKILGSSHPETAQILNNMASLFDNKNELNNAELFYRKALAIKETTLGLNHPETAVSYFGLANVLIHKGDYDGAEVLYQKALIIVEKTLGGENTETALILNGLALVLENRGNYEDAKRHLLRALTIQEKVSSPDDPNTTVRIRENFERIKLGKGNHEEAEQFSVFFGVLGFFLFLSMIGVGLGVWHPWLWLLGGPMALFGVVCFGVAIKRHASVFIEPYYHFALAINEKAFGPEHFRVANFLNLLAIRYHKQQRYKEAEGFYKRALTIFERELGINHPDVAKNLYSLATLLFQQERIAEAVPYYHRALEIYEINLAKFNDIPQLWLINLAVCYNQVAFHENVPAQNWSSAEVHYSRSIGLFQQADQPIEKENVELNLQTTFHLSGQAVDMQRVKELTQVLEDAGDQRAEKGHKLLMEYG